MQTVTTKYLPSTNTRGSRIKVSSWLGNKTFSYDYSATDAHNAAFCRWLDAVNLELHKKYEGKHSGFKFVASGGLPDGTGNAYIVQ